MNDDKASGSTTTSDGINRRNVMMAAAAAGLIGLSSTATASGSTNDMTLQQPKKFESTEESSNIAGRLIVGEIGYDTIQEAWDDAVDGDTVYVHSSYDAEAAGEKFPIVIDQREKEVGLEGGHPSGSEINAEHVPDKNIIEVYGLGPSDFRNTPRIQNLRLVGGKVGLQVVGAPNASFSHLKFFKTNSHGAHVTTTSDDDRGSHGTRWYDCEAWSCGGSGFRVDTAARPHSTTFIRCNATWNGWNGNHPGVQLRGFSSVWQSGTIQSNSSYGLKLRSGSSQVVRDSYFESNGIESDYPVQINAGGTIGLVIEGCYFLGRMFDGSSLMNNKTDLDNVKRGITLHNTHTTTLRSCSHWHHSEGFVAVQGAYANDNDLYESSHHNIHGEDRFLAHDFGNRTRSNGVIRPQDMREIEGKYHCDQGIHDGSGDSTWGPVTWTGSNWLCLASGEIL